MCLLMLLSQCLQAPHQALFKARQQCQQVIIITALQAFW